jgi:hypothetical protein
VPPLTLGGDIVMMAGHGLLHWHWIIIAAPMENMLWKQGARIFFKMAPRNSSTARDATTCNREGCIIVISEALVPKSILDAFGVPLSIHPIVVYGETI